MPLRVVFPGRASKRCGGDDAGGAGPWPIAKWSKSLSKSVCDDDDDDAEASGGTSLRTKLALFCLTGIDRGWLSSRILEGSILHSAVSPNMVGHMAFMSAGSAGNSFMVASPGYNSRSFRNSD